MQASKIRYTEKMMDEAEGFRSRTYRGLGIGSLGSDLPGLLEQAARGMYSLTSTHLMKSPDFP